MISKICDYFTRVINFIFPTRCILCDNLVETSGLCNKCWSKISWISDPVCKLCGTPFEIDIENLCASCLSKHPNFDKAISVFKYDDFSRNLILKLKHFDNTRSVNQLSTWMYRTATIEISNSDIIVPVPIHFIKRIKRKYNQSELLSKQISKLSNKTYIPDMLHKTKNTTAQEGLSAKKRKTNIINSFGFNKKYTKLIMNKNVILIDDVFTTGSTVNECSKILKKHHAKTVKVITLARVVK